VTVSSGLAGRSGARSAGRSARADRARDPRRRRRRAVHRRAAPASPARSLAAAAAPSKRRWPQRAAAAPSEQQWAAAPARALAPRGERGPGERGPDFVTAPERATEDAATSMKHSAENRAHRDPRVDSLPNRLPQAAGSSGTLRDAAGSARAQVLERVAVRRRQTSFRTPSQGLAPE
jgi:hypothetical protein